MSIALEGKGECMRPTMAMHLARPTKTSPVRRSLLSDRNAHARPSCVQRVSRSSYKAEDKTNHEERGNDPIHEYTEPDLYPKSACSKKTMQRLKPHFTQNRIHHDEQADSYRDGYPDEFTLLERGSGFFDEVSKEDTDDHGEEDPYCEEAVEPS